MRLSLSERPVGVRLPGEPMFWPGVYRQLHGEHAVSMLDLSFNTGPETPRYLIRSSVDSYASAP
jgi:hypothetical protein